MKGLPQSEPKPEAPAASLSPLARRLRWAILILLLVAFGGLAGLIGYRFLRVEYCYRTAENALRQRDLPRARHYLEICLEAEPNRFRNHFLLAQVARHGGFFEEAERQLDICQRLKGPPDRIGLERTLLQVQQGAFSALTESLLQGYLDESHPESDQILEALSRGCLHSYRLDDAKSYLDLWAERRPDDPEVFRWLGWVEQHMFRLSGAIEAYRRAVELDPGNEDSHLNLAQLLLLSGANAEAEEHLEGLHQKHPDSPLIAVSLAQCQVKLGQTQEAQQLLDQLLAAFPDDPQVLLERGRFALQSGQAAQAEPWLRRAAQRAPHDYQAHYSLFLCLKQLGKEKEAEEHRLRAQQLQADLQRMEQLTEGLRLHPYDLNRRCEIALEFLHGAEDQEGIRWLKNVLKIDPQHGLANRLLADYYEQHGQPEQATRYRRLASPEAGPAAGPGGRR